MSKKHRKVCTAWNYIEHLPIVASAITGYVSIYAFASLVVRSIDITSSAKGLKIYVITAAIKIALLSKIKLKSIDFLIPRTIINSYNSDDQYSSVNNVSNDVMI